MFTNPSDTKMWKEMVESGTHVCYFADRHLSGGLKWGFSNSKVWVSGTVVDKDEGLTGYWELI